MPNQKRCRADHYEMIKRHIHEMVAEVLDPFIGMPTTMRGFLDMSAEFDAFNESFAAFAACWGIKGAWPIIYGGDQDDDFDPAGE